MQSTLQQYAKDAIRNAGISDSQVGPNVERVIASMREREETAGEYLVQSAVDLGLDREQAEGLLINSGLFAADPAPEQPIDRLTDDGEQAPTWFRQYAEKIDGLVRLAQDRLGVRV